MSEWRQMCERHNEIERVKELEKYKRVWEQLKEKTEKRADEIRKKITLDNESGFEVLTAMHRATTWVLKTMKEIKSREGLK